MSSLRHDYIYTCLAYAMITRDVIVLFVIVFNIEIIM